MNKPLLKTIHETFIHTVHICDQACELLMSQRMFDKNMVIVLKDPSVGIMQRELTFEVCPKNVL